MSELAVGSLKGLAANSFVIDVASGSKIVQPGAVLQVVSGTKTDAFTASVATGASGAVTGLTATITPSSSTSKILVTLSLSAGTLATQGQLYSLTRGGTEIYGGDSSGSRQVRSGGNTSAFSRGQQSVSITFLDSPSSTSALTYGVNVGHGETSTTTIFVNRGADDDNFNSRARTPRSITLMEIAG
jgi:hypothetical protein